jgi:hypothetical protein
METIKIFTAWLLMLFAASEFINGEASAKKIRGAWTTVDGSGELLLVIEDNYCTITSFNKAQKKFNYTRGGILSVHNDSTEIKFEFSSKQPSEVGSELRSSFAVSNDQLRLDIDGEKREWTRVDAEVTPLTGCWRIDRRHNNPQRNGSTPNSRKTLKILSGTRFQWMAINSQSGEFFGTGGGTYTFKDGKYTENIQFFSRDSSRVGSSLTFEGSVENGVWRHKGLSSTGKPVDEHWVKH